MKIFLHIGFPRTGTTFLQEKFFNQIIDYENNSRKNYFLSLRYLGYIMLRSFPKMKKYLKK